MLLNHIEIVFKYFIPTPKQEPNSNSSADLSFDFDAFVTADPEDRELSESLVASLLNELCTDIPPDDMMVQEATPMPEWGILGEKLD